MTARVTAEADARRWDLAPLLANRSWVRRTRPFPHVVARDVFDPRFYAELEAEYRRVESAPDGPFQRNIAGYDATGAELDAYRNGPLGVFVSREWHDLIARVADVTATGDVAANLHHHDPGSASGWPHNDLNPGWFADPVPDPTQVRIGGERGVGYHHGTRPPGVTAHESVRAVSLLFYLGNPTWHPGDGGETGLFASAGDAATRGPAAVVPPINNSLMLFECTPYSWHAFRSNHAQPRNSLVMWLHREKSEAVRRWGEHSIVHW